jgi:signal transduction histidine kinase
MGRYRALARLYRTLGHDLKAPLNALTINLDLLKTSVTRYAPPEPLIRERQARYLKVLEDELARLNRSLVTFLAQAVPPTQETAQPFNLRELLMELISLIAPQARQQQVAVEVLLDERDMILEGQRDLLKQALLNMTVNALEAMPGGGRLTVKLETRMGRAVILLRDSGAGIKPEDVEKIWELHYTTKKTGSGIGLYVARSVIESFGGTIGVEAADGQGTCFTVSLPITSKEAM